MMFQIFSDGSSQWLDDTFMHDPGDKSECPSPEVLVVSNKVVSEGVAGQENFLFEWFVGGRFRFLYYFPIEKHGFP